MGNVKGITFDNQVFTSKTDGLLHERAFTDGILSGCTVTYNAANVIIAPGFFIIAGRLCQIPSALTLATMSTYANGYGRVKASIDLSQTATDSTFEQAILSVDYSETDSFSTLTKGQINTGSATLYECEFAVIQFASYAVSSVVRTISHSGVNSPAVYVHAKTGTNHALVNADGGDNIKFVATANFAQGDTFTVNGTSCAAHTQDGATLPGGYFASGATVCCFRNGNDLTLAGIAAMPISGGAFSGNVAAYSTARNTLGLVNEECRSGTVEGTLQNVVKYINVI